MSKMIQSSECYYCGYGPAGEFGQSREGFPICEGCREEWFDCDEEDYYCYDWLQDAEDF